MPLPNPKLKAAEAKKLEAERLQGFLQEMLREEENKYCADCEQKQPRWASWKLGVFLCIRCAGLHRNLGVHISKVCSLQICRNLKSFTGEICHFGFMDTRASTKHASYGERQSASSL